MIPTPFELCIPISTSTKRTSQARQEGHREFLDLILWGIFRWVGFKVLKIKGLWVVAFNIGAHYIHTRRIGESSSSVRWWIGGWILRITLRNWNFTIWFANGRAELAKVMTVACICPSLMMPYHLLETESPWQHFLFLLPQECACQRWIQSIDRLPHTGIDWHPIHNRLSYTPVNHPKTSSACPNFCWFARYGWRTTFHTKLVSSCRHLVDGYSQHEKLQIKWYRGWRSGLRV